MDKMNWISVKEQEPPKGKDLLLHIKNSQGKGRRVKAIYIEAKTLEAHIDSDWFEYDEKKDMCWCPAGWYEDVYGETGLEFDLLFLGADLEPLHWILLPEVPKDN